VQEDIKKKIEDDFKEALKKVNERYKSSHAINEAYKTWTAEKF